MSIDTSASFSSVILLVAGAAAMVCPRATAQCETQKLVPADPGENAEFGMYIGLSGDTAVIGAPHDVDLIDPVSGRAYVFELLGTAWSQTAKLLPLDSGVGDSFGGTVAIDGDTILVGSPRDDDLGDHSGSVYVFERSGSSWTQTSKLRPADGGANDYFGSAISLAGNVAVIGAHGDDDQGADSGSAYVFKWSPGGSWTQTDKLLPGDGAAGEQFGKAVASDSDLILVGATTDGAGSVYAFGRKAGAWLETFKMTPSDGAAGDLFGTDIDLSGETAVISAYRDDDLGSSSGSAYVFQHLPSGDWSQTAKLHASDGHAEDWFSSRVAIFGSKILIGAMHQDSVATDAGAAYLFELQEGAWVQTLKIVAGDGSAGDLFGLDVVLADGVAIVGARFDDAGAAHAGSAYVFGACPPQIDTVTATSAQAPGVVTATGKTLGQIQQVLIDGVPAALISVSDTSIAYQPQPGAPGHVSLEASGLDGTATAVQQLFPSLLATTTGVGGTLNVTLDNGTNGLYALAVALGSLPAPIPITSPPTWHGVLLDPTGPLFVIGTGAFATSAPVALSYPVPANPALAGLDLYLQAWCQQGFFGPEVTYSFTNMGAVTL